MVWARLDDNMPEHEKVVELSDGAFRLLVSMICHCARHTTDGHIPKADVPRLMRGYRPKYLTELWDNMNVHLNPNECDDDRCMPRAGGVYVHGFLDRNPSRAEVEEERSRNAERTRKWRDGKRDASRKPSRDASGAAAPSRPDPTPKGVGSVNGFTSDGESPPLAEGGGDIEVVSVEEAQARARSVLKPLPTPGPDGAKECPCGKDWTACDTSCPKLNAESAKATA